MGRPPQCDPCCGDWYTTEKLTYDDGIKRVAKTDFFYDHSSAITGSGEYSPSYGWLETWDVYPDPEGIIVFSRGVDFNNSLERFSNTPFTNYARCRRVYDEKLDEIGPVSEGNADYYFDKGLLSNAGNENSKWLPLLNELVSPNDVYYKKYRNPNHLTEPDSPENSDFYTNIDRRNSYNYVLPSNVPPTDERSYFTFQVNSGSGGSPVTVYSIINWPVFYETIFFKYNPSYTSIPNFLNFEDFFNLADQSSVRRDIQIQFFETDLEYIYVFVDLIVNWPEINLPNTSSTLPDDPDFEPSPEDDYGLGNINILIKLDLDFNLVDVVDYNLNSYFTPEAIFGTVDIPLIKKIRIKNNKIYVLRHGNSGFIINSPDIGVGYPYPIYGEDIIEPRSTYWFDIIDLDDYSIQPRFTGGVNYPKYHAIYSNESSRYDIGSVVTFNKGSLINLDPPYLDFYYNDSDINQVLDSALILPLCSETNYIEIYTKDTPSPVTGNTSWGIDSIIGGSIVSTSFGKNGLTNGLIPNGTDISYGTDRKTTVLIDFSTVDTPTIILSKVITINPPNQGSYQKTLYRAVKYKRGSFFSYISRPKDFDVDVYGNIYMLMDHDSVILPSETSLISDIKFNIDSDRFLRVLGNDPIPGFTSANRDDYYTYISQYYNNIYDTQEELTEEDDGRVTNGRGDSVHIPFEKGTSRNYYSTSGGVSTSRLQYAGIAVNSELKSLIQKNGGIRPDGTEYADVVKISGDDGSLIDGAVYFNSWLSTGLKYYKQVRRTSRSLEIEGRNFFFEAFSGVPVNCIEVTNDGVWVGGGQVWPTYGTLGDYIPPRWPELYNSEKEYYQYDENSTQVINARPNDLENCYVVTVQQFFEGAEPDGQNYRHTGRIPTHFFIGSNNSTYISPAWNTDAIQIYQGDFEWLVGWIDTSTPRNPDINEELYKIPYNTPSSDIPTKYLPNFNPIITGGPAIQQDIVVDGVLTYATFDAFNLKYDGLGEYYIWTDYETRVSTVTGVCYTDEYGSFFPASSRGEDTYLKADYPYNLLLFDFNLSLKDKYYFGPSNMDYDKVSSKYIMSQFSYINGMCSIGDNIYITGNRRHDNIVHCAGDENANDNIE